MAYPDTVVTLGDFAFSRFEIPEKIPFGGAQILAVQKQIGGKRVIDAMGPDEMPLAWSGLFQGENALERARYLHRLRIAGKALPLNWDEFRYSVLIERFECDFERYYKIPYRITCLVVEDMTTPVTEIASAGIDESITDDMNDAMGLGDLIGDDILSGLLGGLNTAIGAVSSFATAAQSTISSVLAPIAAVQSRVGLLISSVGNTVANVTTLGGVVPNNPLSQVASRLTGQAAAMTQLPQLYNLQSVMGRMTSNLGTIGGGIGSIATAGGGTLFELASQKFGDATAWTGIANANNLVDPMIQGIQNIKIPSIPDFSGGILKA